MKYGKLHCRGKMDWSSKQMVTLYLIKLQCSVKRLVGWSVLSAAISHVEDTCILYRYLGHILARSDHCLID